SYTWKNEEEPDHQDIDNQSTHDEDIEEEINDEVLHPLLTPQQSTVLTPLEFHNGFSQ
ncbi:hypothetical protein MKW92_007157, partial [Papaver armeniacum]